MPARLYTSTGPVRTATTTYHLQSVLPWWREPHLNSHQLANAFHVNLERGDFKSSWKLSPRTFPFRHPRDTLFPDTGLEAIQLAPT
jgi:hypothetical protein